jgi:Crp-like helix-turn-helix protein
MDARSMSTTTTFRSDGAGLRSPLVAGGNIPLTQDFLAQMMGVRRTSVTVVAGELQKAGMISYARGRIHIKDVDLMRQWACECDADVQSHLPATEKCHDRTHAGQ